MSTFLSICCLIFSNKTIPVTQPPFQIKSLKKSDRNIVRIAIIAHSAFRGEFSDNPELIVSKTNSAGKTLLVLMTYLHVRK